MIGLTVACLLAMASGPAWGQEPDEACTAACRAAREQCVTECSEHDDPIECDARCKEQADDCLDRCE